MVFSGLPPGCRPTQALVEALADPGQDGQRDEVTEAGGDGRGHVVGVDARLLGAHNDAHHDDACSGQRED